MKQARRVNKTRILIYLVSALVILGIISLVIGSVILGFRGIRKISSFLSLVISNKTTLEKRISDLEIGQQKLADELVICQRKQETPLSESFEPLSNTISEALPIGFALGSGWGTMFIDKGASSGISPDDWVVTPGHHLIGKIDSAHQGYSIVRTIFDPRLKITASTALNNTEGLFSFQNGFFTIDLIPSAATTTLGTIVFTSGNDGQFPKGLILGTITAIKDSRQPPLKTLIIQPIWDPPRTATVVVVKNIFR